MEEGYCKNPNFSGCMKRCPCRVWIQCSYYNKQTRKVNKDEFYKDVHEWFDNSYREHYNSHGEMGNG